MERGGIMSRRYSRWRSTAEDDLCTARLGPTNARVPPATQRDGLQRPVGLRAQAEYLHLRSDQRVSSLRVLLKKALLGTELHVRDKGTRGTELHVRDEGTMDIRSHCKQCHPERLVCLAVLREEPRVFTMLQSSPD